MEKDLKHLEDLQQIRSMMERSSRFISLSGLSGVFVGLIALAGALFAYYILPEYNNIEHDVYPTDNPVGLMLWIDAIVVLLASVSVALWFSYRKAKKNGLRLWDKMSKRVFWNMMIPLVAGGILCVNFIYKEDIEYVSGAMLLFYGLALVNASKYTFDDLRYMGLIEIALGIGASVWPGNGLLFWTIGFGIMHIVYGILMYYRYEK